MKLLLNERLREEENFNPNSRLVVSLTMFNDFEMIEGMENASQSSESIQTQQTQPPLTPVPSNSLTHSHVRMFVLPLVVVIAMVLIGVGGYYLGTKKQVQPTQLTNITPQTSPPMDETTNWKTYTNSVEKYSLKYPPTWVIQEQSGTTAINSNQIFKTVPNDVEGITYWINITPYNNPNNLEFKELVTKDLPTDLKKSFTYTTETINNNFAYRTTSLPSQSGCEWVFFKKDTNYVGTNFCMYDKQKPFPHQEEFYQIFNKVLSTFQFTNQN